MMNPKSARDVVDLVAHLPYLAAIHETPTYIEAVNSLTTLSRIGAIYFHIALGRQGAEPVAEEVC